MFRIRAGKHKNLSVIFRDTLLPVHLTKEETYRGFRCVRNVTIGSLLIFYLINPLMAEENTPLNDDPTHNQGVELARQGKHKEGLKLLQSILNKTPDNYPVQRDFIIIARWADDCDLVLKRYQQIKSRPNKEAYLLVPVAECLEENARLQQAIDLLKAGLKDWPDDEELQSTLKRFEAEKNKQLAATLSFSYSNSHSEPDDDNNPNPVQGSNEWRLDARYEQRLLWDELRAYVRYTAVRAHDPDPAFDTRDLNRRGLGFTYRVNYQWTLDYEYSDDSNEDNAQGNTGLIMYKPDPLWEFSLEYASYAEDIPLRVDANNPEAIESDRSVLASNYHSKDYQWTWHISSSHYDFSDQNQRKSLYTSLGLAFELEHQREQRVILELYRGSNSLRESVVYYNPEEETSVALAYRIDFVYDSKFQRHVDRVQVTVGSYNQENYGSEAIYSINAGQDYDFNDNHSMSYGISYGSSVYDGGRETQASGNLSYAYRF